MSYDKKLQELGITLPAPPHYPGALMDFVKTGNLLFLSGCLPMVDGKQVYKGKLGTDITIEQGYEAARISALSALSIMREALGTLDRVKRIVRVIGYVASAEGFTDQGKVVNGFSDVLTKVFGENGRHARISLGVAALAANFPVEFETIVEIS